ncbi:MAG: hypothetical protein Q8Q59_09840 [Luteolibacter sp.]|jgi:hypothetical protein|nr:hypothetical protein [Luteolibacter sp.]
MTTTGGKGRGDANGTPASWVVVSGVGTEHERGGKTGGHTREAPGLGSQNAR